MAQTTHDPSNFTYSPRSTKIHIHGQSLMKFLLADPSSHCNSSTGSIPQYIDHFLGPLSTKHSSYFKDTYHFLDIIGPMAVPTQVYLFTTDIESLHTNINTDLGLEVVQTIFNRYPNDNRPDQEFIQLLSICLKNNDFCFNNDHYLQISRTTMGHRNAPSYDNIYMSV